MAIVNLGGSSNKLAKNVNSIRDVRTGHTQIDKAPNYMAIPSRISERFTISGTKLEIELHGSLDSAMISEGGASKKISNVLFLGQINAIRGGRDLNPKKVTKRTKIGHNVRQ
jgi:hypothetical protein